MRKNIEKLLFKSLDDPISAEKLKTKTLSTSDRKKAERIKTEMSEIHSKLKVNRDQSFKPFFVEGVMKRIVLGEHVDTAAYDFFESLFSAFKPVLITATFMIIGMIVYSYSTGGIFSMESLVGIPEYNLENIAYAIQ